MSPTMEKDSRKKNHSVVNEKTPLLPTKASSSDQSEFDGICGASFAGAVFNLSTSVVGAGIMSLPATMKVLGLGPGVAMILMMALLTEVSIEMLMRFSRAAKAFSYSGVMGDAFGKTGRMMLQICIILNNFQGLIVYTIIVGDVLSGKTSSGIHHPGILEGWFGQQWWTGRSFVIMATTILVFAPLASFKRIDSLRFTSAMSVALAVVFVVITAGIAIVKLLEGSVGMPRLLPNVTDHASIWKLFTVIPVLVTAFNCHFTVHSIDNELEDSSDMQPTVRTSLILCSSVYVATSFFGFLLFGDNTLDDILANFDSNLGIPFSSLLNDTVRVSYALHLMLVFPVVFHAMRINVDGLLFPSSRPLDLDNKRFIGISIAMLGAAQFAANFIPNIWIMFQFMGATTAVSNGFIFPASIALRDPHGIATRKDRILGISMIVLAVFSSIVAISNNAYSVFNKSSTSPKS
ncbi:hypothetical protein AMTR_s00006p00254710 [Amborella trichopoda]|uniref:Amino acid transporter transmembrane domain-containing protein n=2 Tax=Amborella trichopoda TaxID=13333 RepID=W1PDT2_AMBTC|nr:hypothetical protein AMTR_s00006p00254710 [Amborella trichopoda]